MSAILSFLCCTKEQSKVRSLDLNAKTDGDVGNAAQTSRGTKASGGEVMGVHYSVLKDFVESLPDSVDKDATTDEVIKTVVKNDERLIAGQCSWLHMLSSEDARGETGIPLVGQATVMISHAWKYNFLDMADAVINFASEEEEATGRPVYIWLDLFVLNQFGSELADSDWLKKKFTNVIRDIGHTVSVIMPFEDPIAVKRVWCLWELYLSVQHANLTITLPSAQKERFHKALLEDPYSVTLMIDSIRNIDTEKAEAYSEEDKNMIFKLIRKNIGFDEINQTVISALLGWIETQCEEKLRAIQSGEIDPEEAMAAPTAHSGSGSTLFRAIDVKSPGLVKLCLLHPSVSEVVNGTSDSWPPFSSALTMGDCDIADAILDHPAYDFSNVPWQIDQWMITEKKNHSYHHDFNKKVPQERVVKTLKKFFSMRINAGHPSPTYEEFVEMSVNGTLPSGWAY